jgi:hypothetical protein
MADEDNATWSPEFITESLNLGLDYLRSVRPDLFTEKLVLTLSPGTEQQLPEGITAIIGRPEGLCVDEDGKVVKGGGADEVDKNTIAAFRAFPSCGLTGPAVPSKEQLPDGVEVTARCKDWVMAGFQFNPAAPKVLNVTPPVPSGLSPTIVVHAQVCAPVYSWPDDADQEIRCSMRSVLFEYLTYRAFAMPQDSEAALVRAERDWARVQGMLGFTYRQQARHASGFFLGRRPDGTADENVIRG